MADERLIFEVKLDVAEAAKRAADLQAKLAALVGQRERLTRERTRAKKQLAEAQTAERDAIKTKEQLRKRIRELEDAEGDNTKEIHELTAAISQLSDQQNQARLDVDKYSNELVNLEVNLKDIRKEISQTQKEFRAFPDTLEEQRIRLSRLKQEHRQFRVGIDGTEDELKELGKTIKELNDDISAQEQDIGVYSRNVGNYANSIKDAFADIGPLNNFGGAIEGLRANFQGLVALGPAGLIIGGVAAIGAATAKVVELGIELDKTRDKLQEFSDESGVSLTRLTAKTTSITSTYKVELEELTQANSNFFTQFDQSLSSQNEALDLVRKGFVGGGNAAGQYLDNIAEFSPAFAEIGLSASETIAIISQQPKSGVFAQTGVDVFKEANNRIREFTDSTRSAFEGIGINSEEVEQQLRSGETTIFEVIQRVSGRLSELPPQSAEVGAAIADIFGGPGEDAGLKYLTTIKDINTNLEEVTTSASDAARAQLRISEATERINFQVARLFEGSSATFQELKAGALEFAAGALEKIIDGVVALVNYFIDLYNESALIRGIFNAIKAQGVTAFNVIKASVLGFISTIKTVGKVVGNIFKGEFGQIGQTIRDGAKERRDIAANAGREIADAWTDAYKDTVSRKKVELISLDSKEVEEGEKTYSEAGKRFASAFSQGFEENNTAKDSTNASTSTTKVKQVFDLEAVNTSSITSEEVGSFAIDLSEIVKRNNERLKLDKEFLQDHLEQKRLFLEKEKAELALEYDEQDQDRIEREQLINENIRALRLEQLELQLSDLDQHGKAALEIELEIIALRQEAKDEEIEADRQRVEDAQKLERERIQLARIGLRGVEQSTAGIVEAFGEQSAAGKAAIALQKVAAAANVGLNLREQISNAITTGTNIAKTVPPPAGPILGATYAATSIVAYTARAGQLLGEIAGFERGGDTQAAANAIRYFIDNQGNIQTASSSSPSISYGGQTVSRVDTFARGGDINRPTLGLIGERGPEYVVPSRVLKTAEGREHVARLESMRQQMISGFVNGGFTSDTTLQTALASSVTDRSFNDADTLVLLQQLARVEARVKEQSETADSNRERTNILSSLSASLDQLKTRIIERDKAQSQQTEITEKGEVATFNASSSLLLGNIELISRQNEAIKDDRYTELLQSAFISRDKESVSRAIDRYKTQITGNEGKQSGPETATSEKEKENKATTTSTDPAAQADSNTVSDRQADSNTVSDRQADSNTVSDRQADSNTVSDRQADSNTVSDRQADSNTVSDRQADSNTVSDRQADSSTVTDRQADSNTVSDRQADSNTVSDRQADSNTVSDRQADSSTVSDRQADSNTVSDRQADSNTVSDRQADSSTVTDRQADSSTVTDRQADSSTVTDRQADSSTVTDRQADSNTVSDRQSFVVDSFLASQPEARREIEAIYGIDRAIIQNERIEQGAQTASVLPSTPEGFISSPTLAPLSASSYVIPGFVLDSPEAQESVNIIQGLTQGRSGGAISGPKISSVSAFALGGPVDNSAINSYIPINTPQQDSGSEIAAAIRAMRPRVLVTDIREGLDNLAEIENQVQL